MKILEGLTQGSEKWKEVRGKYRVASEASMVMDCHANVSRAELIRMKATGSEQAFSDWVERNILDKGHKVEALARPLIEAELGELYPVVGLDDTETYLASFDGITLMEDTVWECKQFSKSKFADVQNQKVPECDYWQVIHQMMVSGAEKAVYTVSDGTPENTISVELRPNPKDFATLQAAWDQFDADVAAYQHTAVQEKPMGKSEIKLPTLLVEIEGSVSNSNLPVFQSQALAMIQAINTELVTDEDFSNAEATVKALDVGEKELESVKARALAQTASIDDLFKTIDSLKSEMRDKRLLLNKLVKSEKEARRLEQIKRGQDALNAYIAEKNEQFTGRVKLPALDGHFAIAIKGKKTMQSVVDAIDTQLAQCKIQVNQDALLLRANLELLNNQAGDYKFLFSDIAEIAFKDTEDLESLIKARIADHKEAEAKRIAEIERQAAAKAQAEAERKAREDAERQAREQAEAERKVQVEAASQQSEQIKQTKQPESPVTQPYQPPHSVHDDAEDTVTITRAEYNQLLLAQDLLNALQAAGVDNWSGYSDAMEMLNAA